MGDVVSFFGEILRFSLIPKYYLYMVVLLLLTFVLGLLVGLGALIVGAILFVFGLLVYGLMQFTLPALFIYLLLALVFILVLVFLSTVVDAVISGLGVNLALDFLAGKKLDFSQAFKRMQPRLLDAVKLRFYFWVIVGLAITIILALPVLLALPAFSVADLAALDFEQLIFPFAGIILVELVLILLILLAFFLLAPVIILLFPMPFFEKKGPRESWDRAWALGKKNYWRNMGFFLLFVGTMMAVGMVLGMFGIFPGMASALMKNESLIPLFIIFFLFSTIVMVFVRLLFQVWIIGLGTLFQTRMYLFNTSDKPVKPKDTKLKF